MGLFDSPRTRVSFSGGNSLSGYKCKLSYHGFDVEIKQVATPYSKIRLRVKPKKNKLKLNSEAIELLKQQLNAFSLSLYRGGLFRKI
jgi:hypothetical protein